MRTTSALYKTLRKATGSYYEIEVIRGNKTYTIADLKTIKLSQALFTESGPAIGQTNSTQCQMTLMEKSENWPRMAQFSIRARLCSADGTQKSEWLSLGTYYTDERSETKYGDLTITAFDSMLMTEQYWTDKIPEQSLPAVWPITCKAWADLVTGANLITIDSRTTLDDTVAMIGLNTASTVRDVLKTIAAAHGANWQVTPENQLRLIPFANMVDGQAAIAGIAIAGISVVGDEVIESLSGLDYAYLGMNVKELNYSPDLAPISGVALETEAGNAIFAGNQSGYILNGNCEFSSSEGVAELCLSHVNGYSYKPFDAVCAILDPAAEVGDLVIIDGKSYQMMTIDWNINTKPTANIGAAFEAEVDHEYTIISPEAKTYRKAMAATDERLQNYPTVDTMQSAISQSEASIELVVSRNYVAIGDYEAAIANLQEQIDGSISTFSGGDVPTLNNYPAVDWTTDSEKAQHVGALYLVTSDSGSQYAGQYFRFEQNGSSFNWVLVEDSALAAALAAAAAAQEAADQAIEDAADAQAAADAAQGTADQAILDAIARAAEAQALAVTQAALDATNKANAALAEAKAYADSQVIDFINGEYATDLAVIRGQIDSKVETYYQASDPSAGWDDPMNHTGDLWYSMGDQLYYRWDGSAWQEMTANPPQEVFDTLDGKARVFMTTPTPPYSVGDIWAQGSNGDILRCVEARNETQLYNPGDWVLASKYTDDSGLLAFMTGQFADAMNSVQSQLDGKAESYYQATDPAVGAGGGSVWNCIVGQAVVGVAITGSSLSNHRGDIWYRTTDDTTWYWDGTQWLEQTIPRELFDTFDGKANIFITQPVPPYKTGDLWVQGATGDILRCKADVDKNASASYSADDWELASKYTDDTALTTFLNGTYADDLAEVRDQIDQKIETWYQNTDPSTAWTTTAVKNEHIGDLWYNTANGVNTTSRWNGTAWVSQDAPKAVFDAIDGKAQVFVSQPTPPYAIGDLWTQGPTGDIYRCTTARASGSYTASDWTKASKYTDDSSLTAFVDGTYAAFVTSTNTALNGKITTYYQNDIPSTGIAGDLWIDTNDNNKLYRYNGSWWISVRDAGIQQALTNAANAQTTADGKIVTFAQTSQPTATDVGDLWIDTDDGNKMYRWSGSAWTVVTDTSALSAFVDGTYATFVTNTNTALDGKITTYYQNDAPTTTVTGDLWIDTNDGNKLYRWNGSQWVSVQDTGIQSALTAASNAQSTADGKIVTFAQSSAPTATDVGDLWIDTDDNNKMYRWSGTAWVVVTDSSALETFLNGEYLSDLSGLQTQIDQKVETWFQSTDPSTAWTTTALKNEHVGDLWYNTSGGVNTTSRWSGTAWVQQDAPKAVFDQIDGKSSVYVSQPTPPYEVGDLWAQGPTGDIYRCTTARASGSFNQSDWTKASKYTDDTALTTFVNNIFPDTIAQITAQLDNKVDTYFYSYTPTLNNPPAVSWVNTTMRRQHVDDLFYDISNGYVYRFTETSGTFSWEQIQDQDITQAMSDAAQAQDTADHKRRVFVAQPDTNDAYDIGDLWVNASVSGLYENDLLRCQTAKAAGESFDINHWELASKYTDDSGIQEAEERMNVALVEVKAELEVRDNAIELMVQDVDENLDELKMHFRFDANGETIGREGSDRSVQITNEEIDLKAHDENIVIINQEEMIAPRRVTVPIGGSLQLGEFLFTPRSSGNMSLLWVGD